MSKQETFDAAARHLLTQGEQSVTEYGACRYRGPYGTKCAVGALIPDAEYCPDLENKSATAQEVAEILERLGHNVSLASQLQQIHDEFSPERWKFQLLLLAKREGLSAAVLDEVSP